MERDGRDRKKRPQSLADDPKPDKMEDLCASIERTKEEKLKREEECKNKLDKKNQEFKSETLQLQMRREEVLKADFERKLKIRKDREEEDRRQALVREKQRKKILLEKEEEQKREEELQRKWLKTEQKRQQQDQKIKDNNRKVEETQRRKDIKKMPVTQYGSPAPKVTDLGRNRKGKGSGEKIQKGRKDQNEQEEKEAELIEGDEEKARVVDIASRISTPTSG